MGTDAAHCSDRWDEPTVLKLRSIPNRSFDPAGPMDFCSLMGVAMGLVTGLDLHFSHEDVG